MKRVKLQCFTLFLFPDFPLKGNVLKCEGFFDHSY